MRTLRWLGVLLLVCACNRGDDTPLRTADGSLLSSSGGDVELSDGSHLKFVITSERYKQWEAARSALRPNVTARFGVLLQPKSPTEKTIERATAFLESDVPSREAIERTGMSVKDFVLMTVALEQEMRAASGAGASAPPQEHVLMPPPFPSPVDSSYTSEPRASSAPTPRADTSVRIDTVFGRPTPRDTSVRKPDTISPTSKPPRDASARKPDTLSSTPKPPRDTTRDTTAFRPPDSRPRP